jgi:superfamily II DNA/RNA helicase
LRRSRAKEKIMTDTLNVTGEFAPAETISIPEQDVAQQPNGFVELGLAPELVQAVADLGYTQPTTVQQKTIPLALPNESSQGFIDLMVSSQTGSGKTAAFLLPVLHTLIQQQAEAEAADKAAWNKLVADAAA